MPLQQNKQTNKRDAVDANSRNTGEAKIISRPLILFAGAEPISCLLRKRTRRVPPGAPFTIEQTAKYSLRARVAQILVYWRDNRHRFSFSAGTSSFRSEHFAAPAKKYQDTNRYTGERFSA